MPDYLIINNQTTNLPIKVYIPDNSPLDRGEEVKILKTDGSLFQNVTNNNTASNPVIIPFRGMGTFWIQALVNSVAIPPSNTSKTVNDNSPSQTENFGSGSTIVIGIKK